MDKKTKITIGASLGALLLFGVGIYLYVRRKPKPKPALDNAKIFKDAYDNLQFEFNKDVIKPESFPYLNEVADVLREKGEWKLKLEGHTDNVGSDKYNLDLSAKRAEAVKKYLGEQGISPERISTEGFGSTKPIADNSTAQGRDKNRRVEFKVVKPDLTTNPLLV
jgi:OOP family OmpA-OmpF porin